VTVELGFGFKTFCIGNKEHRLGGSDRTARIGEEGVALLWVAPDAVRTTTSSGTWLGLSSSSSRWKRKGQ